MHKLMMSPLAPTLLACGIAAGTANATTITVLEQTRWTSTFVNAPQCSASFFGDEEAAFGEEAFHSHLATEHSCDSGVALGMSAQTSIIGAVSLTATGSTSAEAHGPVPGTVHAFGDSFFEVTFELDLATAFTLSGVLEASASDAPFIVLGGASVRLTGPAGEEIFELLLEPGSRGAAGSAIILESGALVPGTYTLRATADSVIDNDVPPSRTAEASFDITFELAPPQSGDLDGDGVIGFGDLLRVLGAWGACVGCPEDLDGSGTVGFQDLLLILSTWGPLS